MARLVVNAPPRPWRVTLAGGKVLATFSTKANAVERARLLLDSRKARRLWVHCRGTDRYLELRR